MSVLHKFTACLLILLFIGQSNLAIAATVTDRVRSNPDLLRASTGDSGYLQKVVSWLSGSDIADPEPPLETILPFSSTSGAAISRHRPALNGGTIDGDLRVFSGESFAINSQFHLNGDLYLVGTPSITVNSGASHGGVIVGSGSASPSGYGVTLNSGTILPGTIRTRADAIALPTDIPTSVPTPSGNRYVNVNSPTDLDTIGDWTTVRSLNVGPPNLTINVPPGNYDTFSMNGANIRLIFSAGTYNFSGTINLNNGSSVQSNGAVTINIGQGLNVNNGSYVLGTNTAPADVKLNVLGSSLTVDNGSQISALVRAVDANVNLNSATIRGQVIANYLNINSGQIVYDTNPADSTPPILTITSPANNLTTQSSTVNVAGTATDSGSGVTGVTVNGLAASFDPLTGAWNFDGLDLAIGTNTVTVRATDAAGNITTEVVTITRELPPDTSAPTVTVTSPANNHETYSSSITLTGTAVDQGANASGISQVAVNGQVTEYDAATGQWILPNAAVNIGDNIFTVVARDNATPTNQAQVVWNVVRNEIPPPTVSIVSPTNNFTTIDAALTVAGLASAFGFESNQITSVTINGSAASYDPASGTWTVNDFPLSIGTNTIVATATDSGGRQAYAQVSVTRNAENQPPAVNAGADATVELPNSLLLNGTATDDGYPEGGTLSVNWIKVTGDGTVDFSSPTNLATSASFSAPGLYVIRLTVSDGELSSSDELAVTVNPANQAPVVDAGADQTINLPFSAMLSGTATDDGNPIGGSLNVTWSKVYGSGQISFSNSGELSTFASFTEPGNYILRLTASDGSLTTSDDITVVVKPENQRPVVYAGPDQTIEHSGPVNLSGTASDDGQPEDGSLTVTWSKVSGEGDVSFSDYSALNTTANFSLPGNYILRLTATDGELSSVDDVSITVGSANQPPVVNAGEDKVATINSPSVQFIQNNINQFNQVASNPGIAVDFDSIAPDTDITDTTINGILFEKGNRPSPSAPLIVVRGTDTFTPGGFSGAPNPLTNKLIPSSGVNVLSPGGGELVPGSNPTIENDDIRMTFSQPVAAVGFEILFQSYDFFSAVAVTIYDPEGNILYHNGNLPVSTSNGGGAPGGSEFFGFVSSRSNIKSILIDESDGNSQYPDSNIGLAGLLVQEVLPNTSLALNGSVSDDGLPLGGHLTSSWTKVSGVGTATFADPGSPVTSAAFSQPGTYVLRLTADDSELTTFDEVIVEVYANGQQPVNQPPMVNAGPDQTILRNDQASLFAVVTDDGLPAGSSVSVIWSYVSGPGTVTFASADSANTVAAFSHTGTYILRVTATDTVATAFDEISITVLDEGTLNQPPSADAGNDKTTQLNANLVSNASAEISLVGLLLTDWTTVVGSWQRSEGEAGGIPPARFGEYVFSARDHAENELRQDIDIRAYSEWIDAGLQSFEWKAYVRSLPEENADTGRIVIEYRDASNQNTIATLSSGDIASTGDWHLTEDVRVPPSGTGFIRIRLFAIRNTGPTTDVFFDGLSLRAVGNSATVKLDGIATDDGLPAGSVLRSTWTRISGEGDAIFGNHAAANSSAKFDTVGDHVLRLAVTDGSLSASDEMTVTITAANPAPIVNAGADQSVTLPSTIQLTGSVFDDGSVRHRWSKVSGPGIVAFSDIRSLEPIVTLSLAGTYVLRLTAEDGDFESSDEITITASAAPNNQPPTVDAGANQTIQLPANIVNLAGVVTDDGLPNNSLLVSWSKTAGAGEVIFLNPNEGATTVAFGAAGSYILRLTVSDGQYTAWDEVAIVVNPENGGGGENQAPVVIVGADQTIGVSQTAILEALSITDDGLPVGAVYTSVWTKISGPGNVNFSNPNDTATYATFSQLGTYVIRLTVSDSQLSGSDEMTVIVVADQQVPGVEILTPDDGVSLTGPTQVTGTVSGGAWKLEYSLTDTNIPSQRVWTRFAEGTGDASGNLGTLDTTLMLNGLYDIRLSATNQSGQTSSDIISVSVERNLKIGHFTVSFEDMNVPMMGLPIQVIRTYDSRDKRTGDFGVGWTLGIRNVRVEKNNVLGLRWYQTRSNTFIPQYCIEPTRPHIVTVTMPDGKVNKFEARPERRCQQGAPIRETSIVFTPQAGTQGTLSVSGDNTVFVAGSVPGPVDLLAYDGTGIFDRTQFVYTAKDGTRFTINQGSGLQSLRDTNGNTVTVSANGIVHSSGKSIVFERDFLGRITQVIDPDGVSNFYTYDAAGDLVSYKDREDNTTEFDYEPTIPHHLRSIVDPLERTPIRNEYDPSGRLLKHIDANGNEIVYTHDLAARSEIVRDRLGNQTTYKYDDRGNVLEKTDALGNETTYTYDANDNVLTETNALGKTTAYTYDAFDNRTSVTDPLGNRTEFTYNSQGRVLTVRDARNNFTTHTYDTAGNLLTTTDATGNMTVNTYSIQNGSLTSTRDALNNTTGFEYFNGYLRKETDAQGNEISYTYDNNGNRATETRRRTNALGQLETITTSYEYNHLNNLTRTIFADGSFTRIEYNELGQQKAAIDQAGNRTEYTHDDLGRLIRTTYADGRFDESTYDAEGRRLTSRDRAGNVTSYEYDVLGRLKKTTYADGTFTTTNYDAVGKVTSSIDALGNETSYTYDDTGRRLTLTNALNQVTSFAYDSNGNQTLVTDALNHTTAFVYDVLDRRTRTNFADSSFTETIYDALGQKITEKDQAGKETHFAYDSLGRLTKVTDALGQETRYEYNELGQQTKQIDALNRVTTYEYDLLGRRTKRILPMGQAETYSYNVQGNLQSRTDFNGKTTTFEYDNMRRLLSKTPDASLNEPTVSFTYNDLGQRATMTDASGTTSYVYDGRNRLSSKQTLFGTLSYTYGENGNLETLRSSNADGVSVDYDYDALNRLSSVKDNRLVGDQTTSYNYDAVGNLQGYTYPNQVATNYHYNSLNRLTSMNSVSGSSTIASYQYTLGAAGNRTQVAEFGGRTVNYAYDDLYRLTSETIANTANNGQISYIYDAVGNRLQRNSSVSQVSGQSSAFDTNDRLISDLYDNNGSTKQSSGKTYDYDFENKLISTSDGVTIVFDGDGNRVAKTVNGVTTFYLVDTNNLTGYAQVVEEIQAGSGVIKAYTYGLDLISQRQEENVNFYQYDGHGSVRGLTDLSGSVSDTSTYDAFGNLIEQTGSSSNSYLYAGEQFDADLGFYYNRARYLNVETGRFISKDSYEGYQYDPKSLHKYLYGENNPVNRTDPSGYFSIAETSITVSVNNILSSMSNILAVAAVASVACSLDAGGSILLDTPALGPCGKNDENRVYRGTDTIAENEIFLQTGHLLSEEARETYRSTGSITLAYSKAAITHQKWNTIWGNELFHAQAHGIFGVEMGRSYGMNRTFLSVTRNLNTARFFAGAGGKIYTAIVPRWQMVPQTYRGAGEGEWLIRFGRAGFSEYR